MSISRDLFTTRVNSTMMSINERFTYLQKNARPLQTTVQRIRATNAALQQASTKNRRLAQQMEKRLSAMAALKIKKKSIRQRLGVAAVPAPQRGSIRDRLTLTVRGRGRGRARGRSRRGRGRSLLRSQSLQSLQGLGGGGFQRSLSMQSLNEDMGLPRGRSRSRSRSRARPRNRSRGPSAGAAPRSPSVPRQSRQRQRQRSISAARQIRPRSAGPQRRFSTGGFAEGGLPRGGRGGVRRRGSVVRGRGTMRINIRNQGVRGGARGRGGRGSLRGRGARGGRIQLRGRRGRRNSQTGRQLPSREELDKQLDQYMANTKSHLDKELDTYMKQSGANDIWSH